MADLSPTARGTVRPRLRIAAFALAMVMAMALAPLASAQPQGGEDIEFASADARGVAITLRGKLWLPALPTDAADAAVVLIHGSGGWSDAREGHHARALAAAGFAVLAFDAFGPRGASNTVDDQSRVSSLQLARDRLAASRVLAARGIPIARQAVMGFSKGGAAALFANDRHFLPEAPARFAAVVAFYPACSTRARHPKPAAPVFFALGELDDYAGVTPCVELAADMRQAGGIAEVTVYPDSAHNFDGDPARTAMLRLPQAENYKDCRLLVEDDGSMTLVDRRFAANDPTVLGAMKATCMRRGASIWTNPRQKERATSDSIAFLKRMFPPLPR